ncbi:DNA helicase PcrA [Desulfolucanica intricata]|uniref:DNA helicase PcrA n=1 Tax=Desulfolucanica intricata TaxID=1285191 RepID=UPI00083698BD|nr:DNA helicase PcrA [Desulfolucanica intricata]
MSEILEKLNPAQAEAVRHTEGPLLILAGAGSGKTRVLTHRIAYLLKEKRISPFNILAITFTNKAAGEMRERVAAIVPEAARDLWVSTFHSACLKILRRDGHLLGYDHNFTVYDEGDKLTLLKDCLKELNIDDKKFSPRAVSGAISNAKNKLIDTDTYDRNAADFFTRQAAKVYHMYQDKLRNNNALDFDDLLHLTVRLLKEYPAVLEKYQNKFRYILVDEYQDTNYVQYILVNMLAQKSRNLCVVGDPDQGIYGWRGADIQNILSFERDYPEAKVVTLEQNYRSTQTILDAANQVISNNPGRKEKRLWTDLGKGSPITIYLARDEYAEAQFVADQIVRLHCDENRPYRDFAVLYRTHAQSRVLEEIMLRSGIPYTIIGGQRFYERKEIKDILAYLRVIVNPADEVSLARIINVPKRGIGEASLGKIISFARQERLPAGLAVERAGEIPGLTGKAKKQAVLLGELFQEWRRQQEFFSVTELTVEILERTGYRQELADEGTIEARTRLENLDEFLSVTKAYDQETPEGSLSEFLSELSLVTDADQVDQDADQVNMMTLHTAKGLEFPTVFLVAMEEGVFPHSRALLEAVELEEERRLAYVGLTRAQERLYLTHSFERTLYGNMNYNKPSRFLEEISPELIESAGLNRMNRYSPISPGIKTKESIRKKTTGPEFILGDKVQHRKWGVGVIVGIAGKGQDAQLRVAFPDLGIKTLIAGYAPLEKAE